MNDNSLIYLIMGLASLICAAIPFSVYMGLSTLFNITDMNSSQLLIILYVITICIVYLSSFGSFMAIQSNNCGKVKNVKQIAGNAGLTTVIVALTLTLAVFVPWFRTIVIDIFPPMTDSHFTTALGYSYFLFWGALYGFSTGGFMAANCGT
jgi:hypothetical protein